MSDGTLKLFAYLLLLQDPEPPVLIGIEEPENGLYHQLLEPLALEIKHTAAGGPQIYPHNSFTLFNRCLTTIRVVDNGKR